MSFFNAVAEQFDLVLLYKNILWDGFMLTIELGLCSLMVAIVLGTFAALGSFSESKFVRGTVTAYTTIIRGIPDIVLIFLFYYGMQTLLNKAMEAMGLEIYHINPFVAGVITIGFMFGAFMAESFRGALLAVPKGQKESALALGMSPARVYFKIVIPQAMRFALPGLNNNWLVLLKATALVSLINLQDFLAIAVKSGQSTRAPFTFLITVAIGYLLLTTVSIIVVKWLEKRFSKGVVRGAFYE
ncbi:ABC transporter permease [Wohlfahrtiimonas sp. G9077]|uniref:ABC transporter permease n=1 Tax=Wohlfahrtiimonas sp. G9077 TaxID=1980118 RepID=UPI000B98BEA1|nr:ABC transporter permease subunit [Wohlfahrtiimonas sp. G9077]OYQ72944.1 ABC transporter [Wohlfahrtiimonas sp. G9077]